MQIIGACILNFSINFLIGLGQYWHKDDIRFWQFPNTLLGDTAVTIFIQVTLSPLSSTEDLI